MLQEKVLLDLNSTTIEAVSRLFPHPVPEDVPLEALGDRRDIYRWDSLTEDDLRKKSKLATDSKDQSIDPRAFLFPVVSCTRESELIGGESFLTSVDNLKVIEEQPHAMQNIVGDDSNTKLILQLVRHHIDGASVSKFSDFIRNKGGGLVILLHGPSGVGKTLTVETIASCLARPLILISLGGIDLSYRFAETKFEEMFETATARRAILLLDEADVLIEARSLEDITRNALVAGKCGYDTVKLE